MTLVSSLSSFVVPVFGSNVLVAVLVALLTFVCLRELNQQRKFRHIPGPMQLPVLGNLMNIKEALTRFNDFVLRMAHEFGPYGKNE